MRETMATKAGLECDNFAGVRRLQWIDRMPGVALAFAWGLAEGTFFFVIPDVLISIAAVIQPKRAWRHVIAAILGSVLGGAIMSQWAVRAPESAAAAVERVPFVRAEMFSKVRTSYIRYGVGAVFLGPLSGIPYKIYAVEAPQFLPRTRFLTATIPARGERFALIWLAFGAGAWVLRRYFGRTGRQLVGCHAAIWMVVYAIYWGRIVLHG